MTYQEWENRFRNALMDLPETERNTALEYYQEMYGDKLDAGIAETEILQEFGSPEACAEKIFTENAGEDAEYQAYLAKQKNKANGNAHAKQKSKVARLVGGIAFTVFAGIPLSALLLVAIASLSALCIGGGAAFLGGFVYIFLSLFSGATAAGITAHVGIGLSSIGVGVLLATAFFLATKATAIRGFVGMKNLFRRVFL